MFVNDQSFCWSDTVAVDFILGICHIFEFTHSIYKMLKPLEFIFISDAWYFFLIVFTCEDITEYAESLFERKPREGFCTFT